MTRMTDSKPRPRYPWLFAVGTVLVILGAVRLTNGTPLIGAVMALAGVALIATRLIQQSIERRP